MFSERFVNLLEDAPPSAGAELWRLVYEALSAAPSRGPLTLYLSGPAVLRHDLTIPERCELMLAPGARITIEAGVSLRVEGAVDLGAEGRFVLGERSSVRLLGPLASINPAWWIASESIASLEDAVRLALDRRDAGVAQSPILLTDSYELSRTLDLGALVGPVAVEIVLVGRHPRGDGALAATLRPSPSGAMNFPLIQTSRAARLRMEQVGIDMIGARADATGRLPPAVLHRGPDDDASYLRCSFWGAIAIRIDAEVAARPITERPVFHFDGCWFEGASSAGIAGPLIEVAEGTAAELQVEASAFVGAASAMIRMGAGALDLQACSFDNTAPERAAPTDLLLDLSAATLARMGSSATIQLSELHVTTRGRSHLRAQRAEGVRGDTLSLSSVVHNPQANEDPNAKAQPVIQWHGELAAAMVVQGCAFEATLDVDSRVGVVFAATTLRGAPPVTPSTRIRWAQPVIVT